jgi:hypothetical protein
MKNKVDINKLIEKKYKGNTLELSDILEEIDLVLNESDQSFYHSKVVRNGVSDSIPEELTPALDVQRHVNNSIGTNGAPRKPRPDEPGYGENADVLPQSVPDKLAEEEEKPSAISKEVVMKVPVMDLFSMITNSKMEIGSEDRTLINNIIKNFGGGPQDDWKARIKLLQNYTNKLGQPQQIKVENMSSAISSLLFLNLFKKLSYFTAQPGKQFEYLMAPLISPVAQVPPDDSDIADIKMTGGLSLSIKFFSAKAPQFKGSLKNLKNHPNGLNYIVGKTFANGIIEFGEIFITSQLNQIDKEKYSYVPDLSEASSRREIAFFISNSGQSPKIACYAINEQGGGRVENKGYNTVQSSKPSVPKKPPTDLRLLSNTRKSLIDSIKKIKNPSELKIFDKKEPRPLNSQEIKTILSETEKWAKQLPELKQKFDEFVSSGKTNDLQQQIEFVTFALQSLRSLNQVIDNEMQKKPSSTLEENLYNFSEAEDVDTTQTQKVSEGQFIFDVPAKLWQYMRVDYLELGNPSLYNSQMMKISDSVSKQYVEVLENLRDLNLNLTNYFATSAKEQAANLEKSTDKTSYADKSIANANNIVSGVNQIKIGRE